MPLAHGSRCIDHLLPSPPPPSLRAGMFKESKLRQVHSEGPAGGPHAASLKVPAPLAGTDALFLYIFYSQLLHSLLFIRFLFCFFMNY